MCVSLWCVNVWGVCAYLYLCGLCVYLVWMCVLCVCVCVHVFVCVCSYLCDVCIWVCVYLVWMCGVCVCSRLSVCDVCVYGYVFGLDVWCVACVCSHLCDVCGYGCVFGLSVWCVCVHVCVCVYAGCVCFLHSWGKPGD